MFRRALGHARYHVRFYLGLALGLGAWFATPALGPALRLVIAADTFCVVYLALMWWMAARISAGELRDRAAAEDEGILVIGLLTLGVLSVISVAIFTILNHKPPDGPLTNAVAIASVPLGWFVLHTVAAFHYANLYYGRDDAGAGAQDAGGFDFPKTDEPGAWEFLYQSFVIGMTAQTSDVDVTTLRMRRVTTIHAVVSFFFNTVVLALAVNVTAQH